ncbi:MAG TPA: recombinase zinc beta ribbon domain-containing protein [Acidimicrobiales bacterium]|nr:recombinase zinc beta ribbon domain-containing protein [Acidimicrobiales bacterium]
MQPLRQRPPAAKPRTAVLGSPPYAPARRAFGHTADRTQAVDAEAEAIVDAAARVLTGETLSSVVREWNDRGITTAGGGPWRVNSLSSLLLQRRLVGPPQILDEETHARLLALHASRGKGSRRATRRYLLTGLLRCWRCGGSMRGMPRSKGADLYVCPGPPHGGCSGTAVTADHAEEAVGAMVLARLAGASPAGPSAGDRDSAGALAEHRQRLADLGELWAGGQISRREWMALRRSIGERAGAAEAQVAREDRLAAVRAMAGTGRALRARWPAMSIDERRAVVQAVLDHVVVLAAEPPRQVFRPERLQPRWVD